MAYDSYYLCRTLSSALVVVDMQNDFVANEGAFRQAGYEVDHYQALEPTIMLMIEQARKEKIPVIFLKMVHSKENDGNGAWVQRRKEKQHPNSCRAGTWGCNFYNLLQPVEGDYVVVKHRYSAFMNEQFDQLLQSLQIDTMIMTGINTNTCVESTARDAHQRDYHVVVISDATACAFPDAYEPSLRNIDRHFGSVISSEKWLSLF
ncbi:cysteine hydrolase [Halalkalibacter hemicellulosilyticus]|uniref:Amidohydrolase RutB n=1 Tax=Halalkalibacter hemicellulosilyticusJCM 9152 TaxID=1236971 RepID=W4QCR5_9BACI|nr:cysteine hydrolase [Halalkalibacter hemicellulosilyticus]GAE29830.1 amidohydrolase RutB [Halalkalibacter hemicellulosilyticusJCM 9152]